MTGRGNWCTRPGGWKTRSRRQRCTSCIWSRHILARSPRVFLSSFDLGVLIGNWPRPVDLQPTGGEYGDVHMPCSVYIDVEPFVRPRYGRLCFRVRPDRSTDEYQLPSAVELEEGKVPSLWRRLPSGNRSDTKDWFSQQDRCWRNGNDKRPDNATTQEYIIRQ